MVWPCTKFQNWKKEIDKPVIGIYHHIKCENDVVKTVDAIQSDKNETDHILPLFGRDQNKKHKTKKKLRGRTNLFQIPCNYCNV